MKVEIELNDGKRIEYLDVDRVDDQSDHYKYKIYRKNTLLAALNTGDVKNLITTPDTAP